MRGRCRDRLGHDRLDYGDLFELVKDHAVWTSGDGVHFNGQGNKALANRVAESALEKLPAAASAKK